MLSDTTAPAEELQDKLTTLEQLLLAYGRVAIGFSGGVDSSFLAAVCARVPVPDQDRAGNPRRRGLNRPSRA